MNSIQLIRTACVVTATVFCANLSFAQTETSKKASAGKEPSRRLAHTRELLGRHYKGSVVSKSEKLDQQKVDQMVREWTKKSLAGKSKKLHAKVARAILAESKKHDFDPVFVVSVIQSESSFITDRRGNFGEIGLMQIKPSTGKWMAKKIGMKWNGEKTLLDPVLNIRLGTAFLSYLRETFDSHARLYLSAYNMGQGNVRSSLEKKVWPKDYATLVMSRYVGYYAELRDRSRSDTSAMK